jgi:hypothetical protein
MKMPNATTNPVIKILNAGDTTKSNPFTICILANPALEAPWQSGQFIVDPVTSNQTAFDGCAAYIQSVLFGNLPNQREQFLADPSIAPKIRLVSLFVTGLAAQDANSLAAQDTDSNLLIARRTQFQPFLNRYGLNADVAYAVSASRSHTRASAWYTSDDDAQPGVGFTLDGVSLAHRYYCLIPGTVGIHATATSMTALHEFGHALSSYSNGMVVDLYVDSSAALNCKVGRPIPTQFANYDGTILASDAQRDTLGYPSGWSSYHCELNDPGFPALMDDYWLAPDKIPEHSQHDTITLPFLPDRVRAKINM